MIKLSILDAGVRRCAILAAMFALAAAAHVGAQQPLPPGGGESATTAREAAAALDDQINWEQTRLIAVQDSGRYKTLDSFAREWMAKMTGKAHLPGLSPLASMFEWLFNREPYADEPLIYIKDRGLRIHFGSHLPAAARQRVLSQGMMTLREFTSPAVEQRMRELNPRFDMRTAMNRAGEAHLAATSLDRFLRLVPHPGDDPKALWFTPRELFANTPELCKAVGIDERELPEITGRTGPIEGISMAQAEELVRLWVLDLRGAWLTRDAAKVQAALGALAEKLPTLAGPEVYPSLSQRQAEARYHAMGKFTWGWGIYLLAALVGVHATVTRWRGPWIITLILLSIAVGLHGYGVGLRWYILGRIPVANMFEAIVASAWVGIAAALVVELIFRTRIFALAAAVTGFFALVLAQFILPGQGELTSIRAILDDVMLRIHTVMIIASYALIFLAGVIALAYLFGYYATTAPARSREVGLIVAWGGVVMAVFALGVHPAIAAFVPDPNEINGWAQAPWAVGTFLTLAALSAAGLLLLQLFQRGTPALRFYLQTILVVALIVGLSLGSTPRGFPLYLGYAMIGAGLAWAGGNIVALLRRGAPAESPALGTLGPAVALALPAGAAGAGSLTMRPILAGGAPGDERNRRLPAWLQHLDWSHLITLNMVFILLFVGIILGAVWADYSWGRPWGWDPKEVFAMNTWLIYAILIHARFVVKDRGLWTAWLSVAGCLMMAFNWCYVNFFIVGLHSYA
jgi:ABC-type transport system involved in cytochrome c biogenesis permease subunit